MPGPGAVFLILLIIGIAAGLLFDRIAGPGWFSRTIAGSTRLMVTSSLVGIAGSFVGHQLAELFTITGYGALIAAAVAALAVLWGWRMVRWSGTRPPPAQPSSTGHSRSPTPNWIISWNRCGAQNYTVALGDPHGGIVTQNVAITLFGTYDLP